MEIDPFEGLDFLPPASPSRKSSLSRAAREFSEQTNRLAELSAEKMDLAFKLRDAQTALEPLRLDLENSRRENESLRASVAQVWADVERQNSEKNLEISTRAEAQRRATLEAADARAEAEAATRRLHAIQAELEIFREKQMSTQVELRALRDAFEIERIAAEQKLKLKDDLISILESEKENTGQLVQDCTVLKAQAEAEADARAHAVEGLCAAEARIAELEAEREIRLTRVINLENSESSVTAQVLQQLMGKEKWSVSELVDELSRAKNEAAKSLIAKQQAEDTVEELKVAIEGKIQIWETQNSEFENVHAELANLRGECAAFKNGAASLEKLLNEEKLAKLAAEAELHAFSVTAADHSRQIASLLHELEIVKSRYGLHSAPGALHPQLSAPRESAGRVTFTEISDIVEQNEQLKREVARLLSGRDGIAEALRSDLEAARGEVALLAKKREQDRVDLQRFKKSVTSPTLDNDQSWTVAKEELEKHIVQLNLEISTLRNSTAKAVHDSAAAKQRAESERERREFFELEARRASEISAGAAEDLRRAQRKLHAAESAQGSVEQRMREAEAKVSAEARERREVEQKYKAEVAARESLDRSMQEAISGRAQQSEILISLQSRLEQEQEVYKRSAEQLKSLYDEEKTRTSATLKFYQTSYEDQSVRLEELTKALSSARSDLQRLQAEKETLTKSFEDSSVRARLPGSDDAAHAEIGQLKVNLRFALEDAEKWRDLATAAEAVAQRNVHERDRFAAEEKVLRARIAALELEIESLGPVDAEAGLRAAEKIAQAENRAAAAEARAREEAVRRGEEALRVEEILRRAKNAEDSMSQVRAEAEARAAETHGRLSEMHANLSRSVSEKQDLEKQVSELLVENRKLSDFFAKELKGDREAINILHNFQVSKSIAASREEQATIEAHRQRARAEFLATENSSLRRRADELDLGCDELRRSLASFDDMKIKIANLQLSQAEAARAAAEAKSLREKLATFENVHAELSAVHAKIAAAEAEKAEAVEAAAAAQVEAETFKNLHKDMSLRLGETNLGELEKLKSQVDKLKIEKEQSEKARAQLAGTLKTVREEASKKDAPPDLIRIKDKRISELEEQLAKTTPAPEWGQMLAVQQDYKAVLTKLLEGKRQQEAHADESANKVARMEE